LSLIKPSTPHYSKVHATENNVNAWPAKAVPISHLQRNFGVKAVKTADVAVACMARTALMTRLREMHPDRAYKPAIII
jgi:hypothetical protein